MCFMICCSSFFDCFFLVTELIANRMYVLIPHMQIHLLAFIKVHLVHNYDASETKPCANMNTIK